MGQQKNCRDARDARDARDNCDAHPRDDRYAGSTRGSGAAKAARLVKRAHTHTALHHDNRLRYGRSYPDSLSDVIYTHRFNAFGGPALQFVLLHPSL